ncbi:MAG: hypothetical protein U0800_08585 [Isosphaeraceae bacterium]
MDRRNRFVPWSDRLEGRQLMTAAGAVMPQATYATTMANTPTATPTVIAKGQVRETRPISPQASFESSVAGTRQNRIKQLPGYLFLVNSNRKLPASIIRSLQDDMQAIQNTLKTPPQAYVNAMKDALKDASTSATITPDHAKSLNTQFGLLLKYSGAPPDVTAQFQKDMNTLVRLDTQARNPALTAVNDYGIMTQYVLSVGRKINPNAAAANAAAAKAAARNVVPNTVASPVSSSGI